MTQIASDFMFASPSALSGVARLLDLFGQFDLYNQSWTPEEADFWALYSDWRIIGQDLEAALKQFSAERGLELEISPEDGRMVLRDRSPSTGP